MKVSELRGALLDYWVARAEGLEVTALPKDQRYSPPARHMIRQKPSDPEQCQCSWHGVGYRFIPNYSNDWAQGGPIIERERIKVQPTIPTGKTWYSTMMRGTSPDDMKLSRSHADTPLVAAMRAYVASKFGDEVPTEEAA